ncbi:maleate isomerase [Hypericibacter adhaerens]|uniref:Maleate isomerase n=1 Tax=Hypericibacter adhaerens TaxID=2602016 RepID=A0A5J6N3S9_9PROT|nr:aspartate/glutamate racemase family protein [Hypericibacter adhaerens]QEX24692.1 maleate isomerase [Hypericibacter adhaerens]
MKRIGLIVPSSNVTMETEIPEMLRRHAERHGTGWTFHSSRARLHTVDVESLAAMVNDGERCAAEVADARVDVIAYACLVALMSRGAGAHIAIEKRLGDIALEASAKRTPVVSSAGALVRTLGQLGLKRVAVVAPYMPPLTKLVIDYLEKSGITVADSISLSVADNLLVGRLDPAALPGYVARLKLAAVDGIVLSACVQMPSLPAVQPVQDQTGLPVVTAATATTREILLALGLEPALPEAGAALGSLPPARRATA